MTTAEYNKSVDQYADHIYRFVLKHIKNEDAAKDIVQDVFYNLILGFEEIKDELKGKVDEMELPEGFANIPKWHKIIMESDMAQSFPKE